MFEFFNNWKNQSSALVDKINKNAELSSFFKKLADESTLALFLIYTDLQLLQDQIEENLPFHQLESFKQIKYLMVLLKNHDASNYDVHLLSKAVAILHKYHCKIWK